MASYGFLEAIKDVLLEVKYKRTVARLEPASETLSLTLNKDYGMISIVSDHPYTNYTENLHSTLDWDYKRTIGNCSTS